MNSPWGRIDYVTKYMRGVSFVSTPSHGGFRVTLKALREYSIDFEYLLSKAIVIGNYAYFEEDCNAQLYLFDSPVVLKKLAEMSGQDADKLFNNCKESVEYWHKDYFNNITIP